MSRLIEVFPEGNGGSNYIFTYYKVKPPPPYPIVFSRARHRSLAPLRPTVRRRQEKIIKKLKAAASLLVITRLWLCARIILVHCVRCLRAKRSLAHCASCSLGRLDRHHACSLRSLENCSARLLTAHRVSRHCRPVNTCSKPQEHEFTLRSASSLLLAAGVRRTTPHKLTGRARSRTCYPRHQLSPSLRLRRRASPHGPILQASAPVENTSSKRQEHMFSPCAPACRLYPAGSDVRSTDVERPALGGFVSLSLAPNFTT